MRSRLCERSKMSCQITTRMLWYRRRRDRTQGCSPPVVSS
jgi:hypothetical protein